MTDLEVLIQCTEEMFDGLGIYATKEQKAKIAGWVNLLVQMSCKLQTERILQKIEESNDLETPAEN